MDETEGDALKGAATGASMGMMFGPMGALVGGVLGGAMGLFGGLGASKAKKQAFEEQVKQEKLRRTQMEYDAQRQQRQLIRSAQQSQAVALSNATQSGAATGIAGRTGSAVAGAAGQTQGAFGVASNNIFENLQIGEGLFASNLKEGYDLNKAQQFQGIASLGSSIANITSKPAFGNAANDVGSRISNFFSNDEMST